MLPLGIFTTAVFVLLFHAPFTYTRGEQMVSPVFGSAGPVLTKGVDLDEVFSGMYVHETPTAVSCGDRMRLLLFRSTAVDLHPFFGRAEGASEQLFLGLGEATGHGGW